VDLSPIAPNDHYHSIIGDKYAYLLGNQVFIYPPTEAAADITVLLEAPPGWHTVSSWPEQKGIHRPTNFSELANSMIALGDYRIQLLGIDSVKVTLAIRWMQGDYDGMIAELTRSILSAVGRLFGMFPSSKSVSEKSDLRISRLNTEC